MFRNLNGQPAIGIVLWLAYGLDIAVIAAAVYLRSEWMAACGIALSAIIISFSYNSRKQDG